MKLTYAALEREFNERQLRGLDVDYMVCRMRMALETRLKPLEFYYEQQDAGPIDLCRRA
jgi:hypothetical protein